MEKKSTFLNGCIIFCALLFFAIGCTNQAVTGSCDAVLKDELWNCKNSDCTGKCVLQVKNKTPKDPKDTAWKDITGGNLNDKDLKEQNQDVRCDCRAK